MLLNVTSLLFFKSVRLPLVKKVTEYNGFCGLLFSTLGKVTLKFFPGSFCPRKMTNIKFWCTGAPARTVGWRDPGYIHTSFLKELWPNAMYAASYISAWCWFNLINGRLSIFRCSMLNFSWFYLKFNQRKLYTFPEIIVEMQ